MSNVASNARCTALNRQPGVCIVIENCLVFRGETNFAILRRSLCGFQGIVPKLCCPIQNNTPRPQFPSVSNRPQSQRFTTVAPPLPQPLPQPQPQPRPQPRPQPQPPFIQPEPTRTPLPSLPPQTLPVPERPRPQIPSRLDTNFNGHSGKQDLEIPRSLPRGLYFLNLSLK